MGEINFYVDDGINVARRAGGGFNRKDIKTGPEMGRVRENNGEFSHCSGVKSVFMGALRPYFVGIRGRRIHYEMDFVQLGVHLFPAGEYFFPRKTGLGPLTLVLSSPVQGKGLEASRGAAVVGVC